MKDLIRSSSPNEKEREKEEEETTQHSYNFHKAMASWKRTSISLGPSLILHQTKKKVLYKVQFQNLFLVLVLLFFFFYLLIYYLIYYFLFFAICFVSRTRWGCYFHLNPKYLREHWWKNQSISKFILVPTA